MLAPALLLSLAPWLAAAQDPAAPAAGEEAGTTALFALVHGDYRAPEPSPGIVVEVGLGSRNGDGPRHAERDVLATAVSDAEGLVRVTLPVPEELLRAPDARVWARIASPGHMRLSADRRIGRLDAALPTRVWVREGATLFGRVVDGRGEPVTGAALGLGSRSEARLVGSASSDADGRFALDTRSHGTFVLAASAPGVGSARVEPVLLAPATNPAPVELALRASGLTLTGRVVDSAGEPVAGLVLTASCTAGVPSLPERFARELDGGAALACTRTDAEGRFRIEELAPGAYHLFGTYLRDALPELSEIREETIGAALGVLEVPAGEPARLVHDVRRLEVHVVDHRGRPVDLLAACKNGDEVRPRPGFGGPEPGEGDPSAAMLTVWSDGFPRWLRGSGDGFAVYPVEPEEECVVTWQALDTPFIEERVRVPWNRQRVVVELRLPVPQAPAELSVRIVGPDGAPHPGATLTLTGADGGEVCARFRAEQGGAWQRSVTLPSGRYRVVADVLPTIGCVVPQPFPREELVPAVADIELVPGEERAVELRLGAGGQLDLEPASPRPIAEPPELAGSSIDIDEDCVARVRARLCPVRATLVSDEGQVVQPGFEVPYGFALSLGPGCDEVVPGWPARGLRAIPVGEWTLRLEREGELLLEVPVRVRAGEVTTVRW